jgi:eukaryotic-like serine/threonine-protein kinase
MTLAAGVRLGPYEIVAPIGAGGMGEVYRARDTRLGRDVAIKVLPADLADGPDPSSGSSGSSGSARAGSAGSPQAGSGSSRGRARTDRLRRFELEARAVAALSHPNIVALYDVGTHDGTSYLVSELLEGETLADALRSGALSVAKAVEVAVQVAKGLAAAHARNIVHRDLKPSNVFLTHDGQVKLLDFGIAKQVAAESENDNAPTATANDVTEAGTRLGTMGYMSPEQVRGLPCDHRADMFAFGCVLYEMLSGQRAFKGATAADTMSAILKEDPPPLTDLRQSVSPALQQIVDRCLEKRPEDRFSSAHDVALALGAVSTGTGSARVDTPATGTGPLTPVPTGDRRVETGSGTLTPAPMPAGGFLAYARRPWFIVTTLALVGAVGAAAWFGVQMSRARWARNVALPEILRLQKAERMQAAYDLARQAAKYVPDDTQFKQIINEITASATITSDPPGARAYYADYGDPNAPWELVGTTPIKDTRIPHGFLRWKLEKDGFDTFVGSAEVHELKSGGRSKKFPLRVFRLFPRGSAPRGMISIPGGDSWLEDGSTYRLDDFWLDRYEVTNAEFKRFVDQGGYEKEKWWKEPFIKDGRALAWKDAMELFKDKTGQFAPAAWSLGTFPEGEGDLPVSGVSWYEAAAFAAFAGKELPTLHHWAYAAGFNVSIGLFSDITRRSNFRGKPLPVTRNGGLTMYGAYDMAGNVREWVRNATAEKRFDVGGAFDDPLYMFADEFEAASPFERSPRNGFRCAKYAKPLAPVLLAEVTVPKPDYSRTPVGDKEFATYKGLYYTYDGTKDLNVKTEADAEETSDGRHEMVSFDAGYGGERVPAHLFLPKNAAPPYQTVVYFPDGYATAIKNSRSMDIRWIRFLVQTGRAVLCPVFMGTYERQKPFDNLFAEFTTPWAKEVSRSLDYLKTRPDVDSSKVAYYGFSLGGTVAPVFAALDDRIRTAVMLAGGDLWPGIPPQEDPLNFAPRVRIPVLILNGKDDFLTGPAAARVFELLGTPEKDKRRVLVEGGHVPAKADEVKGLILAWLEKYLGKVQMKRQGDDTP